MADPYLLAGAKFDPATALSPHETDLRLDVSFDVSLLPDPPEVPEPEADTPPNPPNNAAWAWGGPAND